MPKLAIPIKFEQQVKIVVLVHAVVKLDKDLVSKIVTSAIHSESSFWTFVQNHLAQISFVPEDLLDYADFYPIKDSSAYAIDIPLWAHEGLRSEVYLMLRVGHAGGQEILTIDDIKIP